MRKYLKNKSAGYWILRIVFLLFLIGSLAGILVFYRKTDISYQMYSSEGVTYPKGRVEEVVSEDLQTIGNGDERKAGVQVLKVKVLEGNLKGRTITVENQLSTTHNIVVGEGDGVILKADQPDGVEPFFSVYNYDRTGGYLLIGAVFAVLMILTGRSKGLRSMAGLLYTLTLVIGFLIPAIFSGWNPVWATLLVSVCAMTVSMVLLNGFSEKTLTACLAAILGVLASVAAFFLFAKVIHIDGYKLEEAEELFLISQNTGLQIPHLLFAGTMISSLGALMDMTMSIASPLFELRSQKQELGAFGIYRAGIRIGQDLIGTMCETLVLAFAGTAIITLLVTVSYGTDFNQLIHSDYLAVEFAQSLTGSIGVILSVPLTAALSGIGKRRKMQE